MSKVPLDQLQQKLDEARAVVCPGSCWRHYKGGKYRVVDIVIVEATTALAVVYTPLAYPTVSFVRPLAIWHERVTWQGSVVRRFSLVSDSTN